MKFGLLLILVIAFTSFTNLMNPIAPSPLTEYSVEWNDKKYLACNTAANANYMTAEERKTIYVLNLARINPQLFATTVLKSYPDKTDWNVNRNTTYYKSLANTMSNAQPMSLLYPDSLAYVSAYCHAVSTGKNGSVTHDRTEQCKKVQQFNGECCQYGNDEALEILMSLLIDEGIPNLGHRKILLGSYQAIGVSIQPHIQYKYTAVLDLIEH